MYEPVYQVNQHILKLSVEASTLTAYDTNYDYWFYVLGMSPKTS